MKTIKPDFERILVSKEQLNARIKELAAQIDKDYAGKKPCRFERQVP